MELNTEEKGSIRQYLLGRLPQDDLLPIEEKLFNDGEFYEQLLIAEDELIDEYLFGDLAESERSNFETHFLLTQERQQKARLGRTLKTYLKAVEGPENAPDIVSPSPREPGKKKLSLFSIPWLRNPVLSASLAAVVLLALSTFLISLRYWRSHDEVAQSNNVISVDLTTGSVRGDGGTTRISIPEGIGTVRLRLRLPAVNYENYRVVLFPIDGEPLWSRENLQPETIDGGRLLSMELPARLLKRDDYQVKVSGQLPNGNYEDLSSYFFRVAQ